jgi:hypothetical protein
MRILVGIEFLLVSTQFELIIITGSSIIDKGEERMKKYSHMVITEK